jgi:hypothetical protein
VPEDVVDSLTERAEQIGISLSRYVAESLAAEPLDPTTGLPLWAEKFLAETRAKGQEELELSA